MTGKLTLAAAFALSAVAITGCDKRASVPPDIDTPPPSPIGQVEASPSPVLKRDEKIGKLDNREKKAGHRPSFQASVSQIFNGYHDNQLKTDAMCKGRLMMVGGEIRNISRDDSGADYVTLCKDESEKSPEVVRCCFARSEEPDLLTLSSGYHTEVLGICDGLETPSSVKMEQCIVVISLSPKFKE